MSDDSSVPGPQALAADFERWRPRLQLRADADPEWAELATEYWAWEGFKISPGSLRKTVSAWSHPTSKLAEAYGVGATALYAAAFAGGVVTVADVQCPRCNGPLLLRSRGNLDELVDGADPASCCAGCNAALAERLRALTDPAKREARAAERRRQERRRVAAQATLAERERQATTERLRAAAGRAYLHAVHPLKLSDTDVPWESVGGSLRAEVAALAMLRFDISDEPVSALDNWGQPLAPSVEQRKDFLVATLESNLLRIDPERSPLDAFILEYVEHRAGEEGEEDDASGEDNSDGLPPHQPLCTGYQSWYPLRALLYAWEGPSRGTAVRDLDAFLAARIDAWLLTTQGQSEALALIAELVATEGIRYFEYELDRHGLPEVAENHMSRMHEAFAQLARTRSLGQIYAVGWRAARDAVGASARNPQAPKANMTTFGLNQVERAAQAAVDPSFELPEYHSSPNVPLSAMTVLLLRNTLDTDPMAASVPTIAAGLAPSRAHTLRPGQRNLAAAAPRSWVQNLEEDSAATSQALQRLDAVGADAYHVASNAVLLRLAPELSARLVTATGCRPDEADAAWERLGMLTGPIEAAIPGERERLAALITAASLLRADGPVLSGSLGSNDPGHSLGEALCELLLDLMLANEH